MKNYLEKVNDLNASKARNLNNKRIDVSLHNRSRGANGLGQGWSSSIAVGFLTTLLAIIGLAPATKADVTTDGVSDDLTDEVSVNHPVDPALASHPDAHVSLSHTTAVDVAPASVTPAPEAVAAQEAEETLTLPLSSTAEISSPTPPSDLEGSVSPTTPLESLDEETSSPTPTPEVTQEPSNPLEVLEPAEDQVGQQPDRDILSPPESPATLAPDQVRILTPQGGALGQPVTNLIIQYNPASQVQVIVNQQPLDPNTPTEIQRDENQNIITQIWYNIQLNQGDNTITVSAGNGTPVSVGLTVEPTTAEITLTPLGDPRIPADGRSTITVEGTLTQDSGELITEDTVVTLTAEAGQFIGADYDPDQLGFQVLARGGQFSAKLQSGLQATKVRIRAAIETLGVKESVLPDATQQENPSPLALQQLAANRDVEAYTQVEFVTHLRPSLVSGVLSLRIGDAGTDFWGSRRDFLNPDTIDDGTSVDVKGAIFATGRVGEWLFTGAYNSDRPLNQNCEGVTQLFQAPQFCDQQYSVYGDSSTVDYTTPSTDSVYLRFERSSPVPGAEPDYAMWGDYYTQEFSRVSQEFTATTRALHGFKGNYNLGNLQVTALYSPDVDGFQRDTIPPDGTSGYYFLSRRLLIPGSETVFLETEELNRPGTVIERKPLVRGPDYEIDYDRGTLLFRRPIQKVDFDPFGRTLVRRIIVSYQFEGDESDQTNIYAGRLQYNFSQDLDQASWLGVSYWREDQGAQDFELYGADFLVPLGEQGRLVGEYAHSSNESPFLGLVDGNAYRLELSGNIGSNIIGQAYYRSVEEGFVNNSTTSFTPGQTRYGANLVAQLSSTTNLHVSYDREDNFGRAPLERDQFALFDPFNPDSIFNPNVEAPPGSSVDNSLATLSAGVQQKIGTSDLTVEYVNRSREDHLGDTFDTNTSQLVSRLNVPITPALTFRAQNELNLGSSDPLYPNRTTLGMDWDVYPGVTLRLAHQFFDGGLLADNSITSLSTLMERQFGENTSLTSRYSIIRGYNGMIGQGAIGLNHRWVIAPGLRVNFGYERIVNNIFGDTAAGPRFLQPFTIGQSASALGLAEGDSFSVGVEYTANPDFQASARLEHRSGAGDNTVISAAAAGKITPALTALFRYQQARFANQVSGGISQRVEDLGDTLSLKLGLAYRDPFDDRFNALLRYEYRQNPSVIPETLLFDSGTGSRDHVFSGEAIYAPNWRWEFYGKFALRNSTTNLARNFSNSSTVYLGQLRAAYRLGYRVDLALEGRWIGQPSADFNEWGWAVEGGYYLTPDLRVGVGYSFGSVDDRDFSGFRSEGGPYLSLTLKVNELLGDFGRQRVTPPQQQDSQVQPVVTDNPSTQREDQTLPSLRSQSWLPHLLPRLSHRLVEQARNLSAIWSEKS